MTVPRQTKRAWEDKLGKLVQDEIKAAEAKLVAIYQAREEGLSASDVAYMIGDRSSSGIAAKAEKGQAILERRRGSRGGSGTP